MGRSQKKNHNPGSPLALGVPFAWLAPRIVPRGTPEAGISQAEGREGGDSGGTCKGEAPCPQWSEWGWIGHQCLSLLF